VSHPSHHQSSAHLAPVLRTTGSQSSDEVRTRKHTHTHLCYRGPRESHTECLVGFEASTSRDLAWAWCVCSVPWNTGARIDEADEPPSPTDDSYDSPSILKFRSAIKEMHCGIFIHSVYVDPDSKNDLLATFVRSEYT
jgi:hypothetical protein